MRREAADLLLGSMVASDAVRVVTADLGFGVFCVCFVVMILPHKPGELRPWNVPNLDYYVRREFVHFCRRWSNLKNALGD